jgi:hypothetical protein
MPDRGPRGAGDVLSPRGVGYWASPSERGLVGRPGRLVVDSAARGELGCLTSLRSWAAMGLCRCAAST